MEFTNKSATTDCIQSSRLRCLGIKSNTADAIGGNGCRWSMYRLIEMYLSNKPNKRFRIRGLTFDKIIDMIEKDIKKGTFNDVLLQEPPVNFDDVLNGIIETSLYTITKDKPIL